MLYEVITEFAVTNLNVPLIVVMGHEACGALNAAVSLARGKASFSGNISKRNNFV